jgi:hypothetical protein
MEGLLLENKMFESGAGEGHGLWKSFLYLLCKLSYGCDRFKARVVWLQPPLRFAVHQHVLTPHEQ